MEQLYFLKQIPETRSDVRHRHTAGVRRESEKAQQQSEAGACGKNKL